MSKVVERAIASVLVRYFDRIGAFGSDQWAFRKQHSCKDLVALLVCRWLWALDFGFKVGKKRKGGRAAPDATKFSDYYNNHWLRNENNNN